MAKFFFQRRRRAIAALSIALSATFSLSMLAACADTTTPEDEDEETKVSATDTQLLRNGNFEFYGEMDEKLDDKRSLISTPTSWSFTSGSPSSNTRSGLIDTAEWDYLTSQGRKFTSVQDAYTHWNDEDVTVYDRLQFFDLTTKAESDGGFKEAYNALASTSDEAKLFADYSYSIDFEDVEKLREDVGEEDGSFKLHEGVKSDEDGNPTETGVLMIHNSRTSDGVMGTAQYYTSSTTIDLEAGTAAEISVWVRTDKLYHWYSVGKDETKPELENRGGAYVSVMNTVGGSSNELPLKIENINTKGDWQQYTVYVRANTYAKTSFRIRLGLGQGTSSDNRYEAVDGYAFFDDVTVKKISSSAYEEAVETISGDYKRDINSVEKNGTFNMDDLRDFGVDTFALDLLAADEYHGLKLDDDSVTVGLTSETSGSNTYYSKIKDNRSNAADEEKTDEPAPADKQSIAQATTYKGLREMAQTNKYLESIYNNDFMGRFPFATVETRDAVPVLMLLSTNGAAYTATLKQDAFTLAPDTRLLVSFFVKTSSIRSGLTGAGVTLVDGENKTSISAFDTTTVSPVDIDTTDEELTDIYKGWVQCFFFVSNDTDSEKTFTLEFTYGPTSVAGSTVDNYCEGYAAFTNFEFTTLTKTQYGYASTGSYAQKVALTAQVEDTSKFDSAEASSDIENTFATPASFSGVRAGSDSFTQDNEEPVTNRLPEGVYAGLLNREHAENYVKNDWASSLGYTGGDASDWWTKLFGGSNPGYVARQPLVLLNTNAEAAPAYGYVTAKTSISANSSQRITLRVKVAANTTAYIYLLDTSNVAKTGFNTLLAPALPTLTYWYDDDGNIVRCDPESDDYDAKTDVLFYLETNGLYVAAEDVDKSDAQKTYYANLANFAVEDDKEVGNLVTKDGTIAYYYNEKDGKYYAYYDEDEDVYTQVVNQLPTEVDGESILRYEAPESTVPYESVIAVDGSVYGSDTWVTVSFYVRTGSEAKNYRLEIWAGERDAAKEGFPAGGYVLCDGYKAGSVSNFAGLRDEAVDALLENEDNWADEDGEKLIGEYALYYTYTLYDSVNFLRHDRTLDEKDLGSHWGSYAQSSYSEGLVWLKHEDDGKESGTAYCEVYLDYTTIDVSVTPDVLEEDDDTVTDDTVTDDGDGSTNVWLILSSSLVAIFTLFAIGAVIVRAILKKRRKSGGSSRPAVKARKARPAPAPVAVPEEAPEAPAPKKHEDDGDFYND